MISRNDHDRNRYALRRSQRGQARRCLVDDRWLDIRSLESIPGDDEQIWSSRRQGGQRLAKRVQSFSALRIARRLSTKVQIRNVCDEHGDHCSDAWTDV